MTPGFFTSALKLGPASFSDAIFDISPETATQDVLAETIPAMQQIATKLAESGHDVSELRDLLGTSLTGTEHTPPRGHLSRIAGILAQYPVDEFGPTATCMPTPASADSRWARLERFYAARRHAAGNLHPPASPLPGFWSTLEISPEQTRILNQIEMLVGSADKPVVIVDLDETSFASKNREVQIWREFAEEQNIDAMKGISAAHISGWDLRDVMVVQLGMDAEWFASVREELRAYWMARFFSNDYLKYDTALPGAALFMGGLHARGAHIVYLTGRSSEEMGQGTLEALRRHGFPIDPIDWRTTLIMKERANQGLIRADMTEDERKAALRQSDVEFKNNAFARIRALGTVVASIDNEPANVNKYFDVFHAGAAGLAVRVATTQARDEPLHEGVVTIRGFLR